ncbi:MAG: cryptochrome/photolyase family protein [Zetaproteobacteria bacterium]|nr:cryptochrome/photolyase family protein [Zetaproteobacteria bacterium]
MTKAKEKSILLILGDQLFPLENIQQIQPDYIFMAEDYGLASQVQHHKQKIMLFFAAMREYATGLRHASLTVIYESLQEGSLTDKLQHHAQRLKVESIHHFRVDDQPFRTHLQQSLSQYQLTEHPSPKFMVSPTKFTAYLQAHKRPFMKSFYEHIRRDFDILMEHGKPCGGKYSYDSENRKKLPKGEKIPPRWFPPESETIQAVRTLVHTHFAKHPGDTESFIWPVTRAGYLRSLDAFIAQHLEKFGPYQDALSCRDPFLFHTLLSPGLNLGLITPQDILVRLQPYTSQYPTRLSSAEGLLRQIIGWREFVKGIYDHYQEQMETGNYWGHQRKLQSCWWEGTTGLPPLDDIIHKSTRYGYAHHIERLMVMANIFNLLGVHPQEAYRWFMEMYVDSAEWVMQANVYGMGLMSEGGIFATKPYICGSNYIRRMSDYTPGPWCDVFDGLCWNFIGKHQEKFRRNPRMAMMVRMYEKLDPDKLAKITRAAEAFTQSTTLDT